MAPVKGKEVTNSFKMEIPAGKANPAPPIGPILGQNGINIAEFCNEFNNKTKDMMGDVLPIVVSVFKDRSFKMQIKQPTVASLIKKKFNIQKGSAMPNKDKIKKVKREDLREIAERKLPDMNTGNIESAISIVAGVAKSMGIDVI